MVWRKRSRSGDLLDFPVILPPGNYVAQTDSGNVAFSSAAAITLGTVAPPPATPTGFTAIAANGAAGFRWDNVVGVTYRIYNGSTVVADNITSSPHRITGLTNGTPYSYQLVALNSQDTESTKTPVANVTPAVDSTAPATPTAVQTENFDTRVRVYWAANTESDIWGYNVYKDNVKLNSTPLKVAEYNDLAVTNFDTYFYKVSAVDFSNNESALSLAVTGNPMLPGAGWEWTVPDVRGNLAAWPAIYNRLQEAASDMVVLNYVGDSITRGEYTSNETTKAYSMVTHDLLAQRFGSAGTGFIAAREGHSSIASWQAMSGPVGVKRVTYTTGSPTGTEYTPSLIVTGGYGAEVIPVGNNSMVNFKVYGNKFTLLYMDRPGGNGTTQGQILVDGVAVVTNIGNNSVTSDTPMARTITTTMGEHIISAKCAGGNFPISGLIVESATIGVLTNRMGREAWKSNDWANRGPTMNAAWNLYKPDIAILALCTNNVKDGMGTLTTAMTMLQTLIQQHKAMNALPILYIMHKPNAGWANYTDWPSWVTAMRDLATTENIPYIDGYVGFFSDNIEATNRRLMAVYPNDFSGQSGSDFVHPGDRGSAYIGRLIYKALTAGIL
jgi:hypothetical protein